MATFNIFGAFFVSTMFLSMHLGQPIVDSSKDIKSRTLLHKSKLENCEMNISDEYIQNICNQQHHKDSKKSSEIFDSMIGIQIDMIQDTPEKLILSHSVVFNDCCTTSCIEDYVKKSFCTDQKYKLAQLIDASQSNKTKTKRSIAITEATSTTITTTKSAVPPESTPTFISMGEYKRRRPYLETLKDTRSKIY